MEREQHIKIAFVGTSCTGKTSLVEVYRERAQNDDSYIIVEEAARVYFQQNPNPPDPFAFHIQKQIQDLALQNEREAYKDEKRYIICDRSVLDAVAYEVSQRGMTSAMELYTRVRSWISTYHAIFLLDPVDVPFINDDVRREDAETRMLFHRSFLELFHTQNIPFTLLSGTIEERVETVDQFLRNSNR